MHYVNAAHPAPLVRRGNTLYELGPSAALVGFFDMADDIVRTFQLEKNDRVFLYTDGINETTNQQDELFGAQRLKTLLQAHQGDHQELLDQLFFVLQQFNGSAPPRDDCTAIVMDFHRLPLVNGVKNPTN